MIDKNTTIKVTNRDNGSVGYTIPDLGNMHRVFESGETKEVTINELEKLSWIPGGMNILKNYLIIDNQEAINYLLGDVEPEYSYTNEDIKNLLTIGTIEQFEDCLDFAPEGVINLLKKYAVELRLNDVRKREILKAKTGFDVTSAIMANDATEEDENAATEQKTRRAAAINEKTESPVRRTAAMPTSKYKVVSK